MFFDQLAFLVSLIEDERWFFTKNSVP